MNILEKEKQIPDEFKQLAKDFADKGFMLQLLSKSLYKLSLCETKKVA